MKKLVILLAFAMAPAFAAQEGKFALGFQESFTGSSLTTGSANPLGAWSIKYGVSDKATAQLTFGFQAGDFGERFNVGARFLYDLVSNENSAFYSGVGVLYERDADVNLEDPIVINVPLGFAFNFAGLPEVEFSAEAGLAVEINDSNYGINSVGGNVGGALGLGVHYYF